MTMRAVAKALSLSFGVGLAAAVAFAGDVQASVVNGSFTGTISAGATDSGNYFGGGALGGQSIAGSFSWDTTTVNNFTGSSSQSLQGTLVTSITTSVTINGVTQTSGSVFNGMNGVFASGSGANQSFVVDPSGNNGAPRFDFALTSSFLTNELLTAAIVTAFQTGAVGTTAHLYDSADSFNFAVTSASASFSDPTAAPVPEPASIALFGAGLAGLSFFRRRIAGR